ncbi:MAG: DNA repair ATPase [Planctomycetes bacterium]|nr:DNA repair ATPase [Planctomycetota bacterium]
MAQVELENAAPDAEPEIQLEGSTYEIIRNRLSGFGKELRARLEKLNAERKEVFGAIDTELLGTERITTSHNCVPRDMVAIGNRFIFGYNIHFGLKSVTDLADVFSVYEFRENSFHEQSLELIRDDRFEKDFHDLFRFYKNPVFAKFFVRGPHLHMVFHVGKSVNDLKTFKWLIQDDSLVYVDSRSDHEARYPPQHEFEWIRTHRDLHQSGLHPHISIQDRVFVETIGGDLTIKIENNTGSGEGIYSEPVDNPDQTLDDAEVFYAVVGNIILLKIRPYQENAFRYIVYNEKIQQARRLDSIESACVLLPDDHGLIFSNGYYLQTGEHKTFENNLTQMVFEKRIAAPNGEDYLYVFYNRKSGTYILLPYNLIEQHVETPIICNGYTLFEAGELVCFKSQGDPQKHHAVQIWQTPYVDEDFVPHTQNESYLYKIGNKDVVRGMSECHEILGLIDKEDTYANLYVDLVKSSGDVIDSYFWLGNEETFNLKEPLGEIKNAATAAVNEFDKVVRVRKNTAEQTGSVHNQTREIIADITRRRFDHINDFVASLADLRSVRGEIISLRELRYADESVIDGLENEVSEQTDRLSRRCVEFLLKPDALTPYVQSVEAEQAKIGDLTKVSDAKKVEEDIAKSASELEMLIEIVGNLKIDDATQRTAIIDNISDIFSTVNQARAALKKKIRELASVEGIAEFNSQMKLINQGVINYLDICDTPEKCEEYLTRIMIQIEELEGRFAEFDEFVLQLSEKREEIYNAFETRKLALVETRNKRAGALAAAADRILKGIKNRVEQFESINDINGYFAADLMIEKVRDICEKLTDLDDSVKVDDIQSRMKTVREDAVRQLKDRQELYVDGQNIIKLGRHNFSVNVQALDLTTVLRDGDMHLHLTGTNFFEKIEDETLNNCRDVWNQDVVSENRNVYRAEYLVQCILRSLTEPNRSADDNQPALETVQAYSDEELLEYITRFMGPRYSEGYVKGVHDHDAAKLLRPLLTMQASIGLLRYHARSRALANVFWHHFGDKRLKGLIAAKLKGIGTVASLFPAALDQSEYVNELSGLMTTFLGETRLFNDELIDEAAEYLYHEMIAGDGFCVSRTAADLFREFHAHLERNNYATKFAESIKAVQKDLPGCYRLARDWVNAFVAERGNTDEAEYADETAALLLHGKVDKKHVIEADVVAELSGFLGTHPVIGDGTYRLHYNRFLDKLNRYSRDVVPKFHSYVETKKQLVEKTREEMKLEQFRPRVLTSFVRNRLLDTVYLPMIGDNLAKQIGTAGEGKRTDRMGLLLLVSPPGYGKTTLMEYLANRLGIIFMKINGPALGHHVTSLDPDSAPNAGAREEIEKLNLAFEMGDNVMIYLDDIQHCNPELLQKFISLCDAQRKIEGVYKGKSRTYDFRGRKVAVVMAGNPYTESGEKFQIPDMLSNRADIYNLGEIIGENADAFEMSYLENTLTSNPVLSKLASRSQKDVYEVIKLAERGQQEGVDLEGKYSLEELNEMTATMKKLMRVRDVILSVNKEYIRSAAQSDDYRTEPPFKLQGSYRNMNRIAERVLPIMNDEELEELILTNYENDAQTLTSDTEANLLKFKELTGRISAEESKRWEAIKRTFQKNVKMRGIDTSDKAGQVIAQLSTFSDGLDSIRIALTEGVETLSAQDDPAEEADQIEKQVALLSEHLQELKGGLHSIGEALSGGVSQMIELAQQKETQPTPTPESSPALTVETLKELAVELRALAIPTEESSSASKSAGPPKAQDDQQEVQVDGHRITVVNKIPPTLLNVLQQQFKLMQGWMEPIFHATQTQSTEIRGLREALEECLADYAKLLERVGKARKKTDAES